MKLTEFLLARLAEDEQAAHESNDHPSAGDFPLYVVDDDYKYDTICISAGRVLAEVAMKRRIVELHRCIEEEDGLTSDVWDCDHCGQPWRGGCLTLRLLALPFAEHPDYREEWKP